MDGSKRTCRPPEAVAEVGRLLGHLAERVMHPRDSGDRVVTAIVPETAGVEFPGQEGVDLLGALRQSERGLGEVPQNRVRGGRLGESRRALRQLVEGSDTLMQLAGESLDVLVGTGFVIVHVS
ncbi:hypothetical protein AB0C74_24095 [Spirillospora sp. NPDC048832]